MTREESMMDQFMSRIIICYLSIVSIFISTCSCTYLKFLAGQMYEASARNPDKPGKMLHGKALPQAQNQQHYPTARMDRLDCCKDPKFDQNRISVLPVTDADVDQSP
jgi:hypothetical protein